MLDGTERRREWLDIRLRDCSYVFRVTEFESEGCLDVYINLAHSVFLYINRWSHDGVTEGRSNVSFDTSESLRTG